MSDDAAKREWVVRVLKVSFPTQPRTGSLSLVKLAKSRFAWRSERMSAVAEIGRLKMAISERFKDDETQASALTAALGRLDTLIGSFGPALDDSLDEVLNGDETKRPTSIAAARTQMARFQTIIEGDEIMSELDGNEVLPDMVVTAPLLRALGAIDAALG